MIKKEEFKVLKTSRIDTELGPMVAIADEAFLYFLEFIDRKGFEKQLQKFLKKTGISIIEGSTKPIESIEKELRLYFEGKLTDFKTPIIMTGTPFQQNVWKELLKIPLGETRSYKDIAAAVGQSQAARAVGTANGSNKLAIIIPCHRVINAGGALGGYAGGLHRKKRILQLEKRVS